MNAGVESERIGHLCTPPSSCQAFVDRIYDPDSTSLAIERTGRFWEGVAVARQLGLTGQKRRVAILDSGFDASVDRLKAVTSPDSRVAQHNLDVTGRHGTAVALLIHEVAPDAELVLIDVIPGLKLFPQAVADGVKHALRVGVDVINMSFEFGSDCAPRDRSGMDVDAIVSPDSPLDVFLEQVRFFLSSTDPYAEGGCRSACAVCGQLRTVRDDVLIVAAAGNRPDRAACPACFNRSVGIGFEQETVLTLEDRLVLTSGLPEDFDQNLLAEVALPQPPGFAGTSFAAPLISGFGALLSDPVTLGSMARLPFALTPLAMRAQALAAGQGDTDSAVRTLLHGFLEFSAGCPQSHRHWESPTNSPCPSCSVFMVSWYNGYSSALIRIGAADRAIQLGLVAREVAPNSPDVALNLGTAFARVAHGSQATAKQREEFLRKSQSEYRRSLELRPDNQVVLNELASVEEDLAEFN